MNVMPFWHFRRCEYKVFHFSGIHYCTKIKYKPIQVFYERVSITGIEEDSDKKAMPIVPTILGKQETIKITLKNQVAGLTPTSSPATWPN